jgi:hypothetical protein
MASVVDPLWFQFGSGSSSGSGSRDLMTKIFEILLGEKKILSVLIKKIAIFYVYP